MTNKIEVVLVKVRGIPCGVDIYIEDRTLNMSLGQFRALLELMSTVKTELRNELKKLAEDNVYL